MSPRDRRDLVHAPQLAGRVVRVADPDQVGAVRILDDVRALQLRDDPVQAVRRRGDRRSAAGCEEGLGAERDQLVGARAGDDLLRLDAAVRRSRLTELAERAVRVVAQPREAGGERQLRHSGKRGRVLVEAQDLLAPEPVTLCDLGGRERPDVGPVVRRERVRPHLAASASAWRGSPSMRASGSAISRARSSESARTNCTGFRKLSSPSPPAPLASPLVGSTCVAPAA